MDIHKPHPVQNWRELLSEIGVIVIGVLIALSAEQAVEAVHWGHKIDQAEDAVRLELRDDDAPQAYARSLTGVCLDRQLGRMRAVLQSGGTRDAWLNAARGYAPPQRTWDMEAWRAMVASDVGPHMGAERLVRWSDPYRLVPSLQAENAQETRDVADAMALGAGSGAITPGEADRLSVAIARLQSDNHQMTAVSAMLVALIESTGVKLKPQDRADILADARRRFGDCVAEPRVPDLGRLSQYMTFDTIWGGMFPAAGKQP